MSDTEVLKLETLLTYPDDRLSEDARLIKGYFIRLIRSLPNNVYWLNKDLITLGCNDNVLKLIGLNELDEFVGIDYEKMAKIANWKEGQGQSFKEDDIHVITTGMPIINKEEPPVYDKDGNPQYYVSNRYPLKDESGEIIGLVGISVDITSQKLAERLKIENELHVKQIESNEKIAKIASQVAHDMASPLASLKMLLNGCTNTMPEKHRIAFRQVAKSIEDITHSLLSQYNPKKLSSHAKSVFLPGLTLQELIQDRKMKHQTRTIEFELNMSNDCWFEGIFAQQSQFHRMMSNLINNSIDALSEKENLPRSISISMYLESDALVIELKDSGCGMSSEILQKIRSAVSFTHGKEDGHGIGLVQVRDTLAENSGRMDIESELGVGTTTTLKFPKLGNPKWLCSKILINPCDLVIIADDDPSIHFAFDQRFESFKSRYPNLEIKHFSDPAETLDFISTYEGQKSRIFLMTDFEFIQSSMNGIDLIRKSSLGRTLLVTSHFAVNSIQSDVITLGTSILPKPLASLVGIDVNL